MLSRIRDGVGLVDGSWFNNNVRHVVGGGGTNYFWTDNWVGGVPLRVKFPRLFDLAVDRWVSVEDMARGVGRMEGMPGCGGGTFSLGRSVLGSVLSCYMTLFCRTIYLTGGGGFFIPLMVIPLSELIFFSQQQLNLQHRVW